MIEIQVIIPKSNPIKLRMFAILIFSTTSMLLTADVAKTTNKFYNLLAIFCIYVYIKLLKHSYKHTVGCLYRCTLINCYLYQLYIHQFMLLLSNLQRSINNTRGYKSTIRNHNYNIQSVNVASTFYINYEYNYVMFL